MWNGAASSAMTTSASGIKEIREGVCEKGASPVSGAPASSVMFFQVRPFYVGREPETDGNSSSSVVTAQVTVFSGGCEKVMALAHRCGTRCVWSLDAVGSKLRTTMTHGQLWRQVQLRGTGTLLGEMQVSTATPQQSKFKQYSDAAMTSRKNKQSSNV